MLDKIAIDELMAEEQVREVRAALSLAGLTQKEFADRRGLHEQFLSRILRRKSVPGRRYADALNNLVCSYLKPRVGA